MTHAWPGIMNILENKTINLKNLHLQKPGSRAGAHQAIHRKGKLERSAVEIQD